MYSVLAADALSIDEKYKNSQMAHHSYFLWSTIFLDSNQNTGWYFPNIIFKYDIKVR